MKVRRSRSSRAPLAPFVVGCILTVASPALGQQWELTEGGLKDLETGLVWGPNLRNVLGYFPTWNEAQDTAAGYVGYDDNGIAYDDWRVPTAEELQAAIQDNTMDQLVLLSPPGAVTNLLLWTSQGIGWKGETVSLYVDFSLDTYGRILPDSLYVDESQSSVVGTTAKYSGLPTYIVRGGTSTTSGGHHPKK